MESFATAYPVLFHDGEQEHDKGHIGVHSVLSFKKFQAQMSRLVGIPANQLSTVLVCRKSQNSDKKQKLPISETTNFNIILNQHNPSRERDCHFLVSIKKSKKERKGTRKRATENEDEDSNSSRGDVSPLEERPKKPETEFSESSSPTSILQRPLSPVGSPLETPESQDATRKVLVGTTEKVERILLRREGSSSGSSRVVPAAPQRVEGFNLSQVSGGTQPENRFIGGVKQGGPVLPQRFNDVIRASMPAQSMFNRSVTEQRAVVSCRDCKENGNKAEFHLCVNDRILVGFRRRCPLGPIQRPVK